MYKLDLYLLRHGKTICNEQRLYCGSSDISLSQLGKIELLEFKKLSDENSKVIDSLMDNKLEKPTFYKFKYPKCDKYFTSGAKRANETFETIYPGISYEVLEGFSEYNFGDFEMKSYEMLKENENYVKWIMDNEGVCIVPNGESKKEFRARISNSFIRLVESCRLDNIDSALLVSHGGTIGTILENFHSNEKSFYEWQPSCGMGYKIEILYDEDKDNIKIDYIKEIKGIVSIET